MNDDCDCDCCAGVSIETPVTVSNRPGLPALAYRVGTWAQFRASMIDALSATQALDALKTRSDDDFTIALLDAFAVVCDILTFYSERSANEHYLGTATDPVSVRELAKLVGYRMAPGVAASVPLALTIQAPPTALAGSPSSAAPAGPQAQLVPPVVPVPVGLQAQSVPGPGEQPVTFETLAAIDARYGWNALRPRAARALTDTADNLNPGYLRLAGLNASIQAGDWLLVLIGGGASPQSGINRVAQVTLETVTQTTLVVFDNGGDPPTAMPDPSPTPQTLAGKLGDAALAGAIRGVTWGDQADLVAQALKLQWPIQQLEDNINALPGTAPAIQVFRLGVRAALFGHNAPLWASLPTFSPIGSGVETTVLPNWDTPPATVSTDPSGSAGWLSLDQVYPALVANGWVVLVAPDATPIVCQIAAARQVARTGFMLSSRVTQISLQNAPASAASLALRTTTVLGATSQYSVAPEPEPATNRVAGSSIVLASAQLGLAVGQQVAITGAALDQGSRSVSEVRKIAALALVDGYTQIGLDLDLVHSYDRTSVTINANVAPATEGASKSEILGSGNGAATWQTFALKQPPLTYVGAATPSGTASTLAVRVNGALWSEVPWLASQASSARVFTTSVDASGNTLVQFGDGTDSGARLPSGQNNVTATYRQGLGSEGNVDAGRITTLLTRPTGLQGVINPVAASGGGDPETRDSGRLNAATTVRALDRIVTLEDVGDFARASAAIAKADAVWAWDGRSQVACVTVAGAGGATLDSSSAQFGYLVKSMQDATDGTVPITLCSYVPRSFTIGATLTVDPTLDADAVVASAICALRAAFGFDARSFMQPVFASEVIATLQAVPGVIALSLDALKYTGAADDNASTSANAYANANANAGNGFATTHRLRARPPQLRGGALSGAELLTLDSGPLPAVVHA